MEMDGYAREGQREGGRGTDLCVASRKTERLIA
eukprot:COSAG06_NODE_24467_length_662_cov_0.587922_1_plen_32_part_10